MSSSTRFIFVLLFSSITTPVDADNKNDELVESFRQHEEDPVVMIFESDEDVKEPRQKNIDVGKFLPLCKPDNGCERKRNTFKPPSNSHTMRMFQLPDYYNLMRSAQRRRATLSTTTTSPKTTVYSRHRQERVRNRQNPFLALAKILNSPDDVKRNLFISEGWGASGSPEYIPTEERQEKNANQRTPYAFTSNHWGPLGKRFEENSVEM